MSEFRRKTRYALHLPFCNTIRDICILSHFYCQKTPPSFEKMPTLYQYWTTGQGGIKLAFTKKNTGLTTIP